MLQYTIAAWWEPVTANSSVPTQWLAPYGNELSGLHKLPVVLCSQQAAHSQGMGRILSPGTFPSSSRQAVLFRSFRLILAAVNGAGCSVCQCLLSVTGEDGSGQHRAIKLLLQAKHSQLML